MQDAGGGSPSAHPGHPTALSKGGGGGCQPTPGLTLGKAGETGAKAMRTPSCPRHSLTAVEARRSQRVEVCTAPRGGGCPGDGGPPSGLSALGRKGSGLPVPSFASPPPTHPAPHKGCDAASPTPPEQGCPHSGGGGGGAPASPTFLDGPGGVGLAIAAGWGDGHRSPHQLLKHPSPCRHPGGSHIPPLPRVGPLPNNMHNPPPPPHRHPIAGVGVHLHPLFPPPYLPAPRGLRRALLRSPLPAGTT